MNDWLRYLATHAGARVEGHAVINFGDGLSELRGATRAAVLCDLSPWGALRVSGADAETFLQGQFTNDVRSLPVEGAQYSAYCSAKGRVLTNFILSRRAVDDFRILLPGTLAESMQKRLSMFVLRSKVKVEDWGSQAIRFGLGGLQVGAVAKGFLTQEPILFRWQQFTDGSMLSLPGDRFIVSVTPDSATGVWRRMTSLAGQAGFPVWQWLTVRAGIPVITPATQDRFIPQMLNWELLGGVSFEKGCYTGQEIVARMQYLGRLKERLYLAHVDSSDPPQIGDPLHSDLFADQSCGAVVNVAPSPEGGYDLLAVIQTTSVQANQVCWRQRDGVHLTFSALPYTVDSPNRSPE